MPGLLPPTDGWVSGAILIPGRCYFKPFLVQFICLFRIIEIEYIK